MESKQPGPSPAQVRRRSAYIEDLLKGLREPEDTPGSVDEQLITINNLSWKLIKSNPDNALLAIDRIFKQLELRARMGNVGGSNRPMATEPEWIALRECMFHALEPFPEAKMAVAHALVSLEEQQEKIYGGIAGEFGDEPDAAAGDPIRLSSHASQGLRSATRRWPSARKSQ